MASKNLILWISPRKQNYFRKYFSMWFQGPGTIDSRKKTRGQKSHATVPLSTYMTLGVWDLVHPTSSSLSMLILKLVGGRGFVVNVLVTGSDSTCSKPVYSHPNFYSFWKKCGLRRFRILFRKKSGKPFWGFPTCTTNSMYMYVHIHTPHATMSFYL